MQLTVNVQQRFFSALVKQVETNAPDAEGFADPFAVLTVAEIARADRLVPFLADSERNALVGTASQCLRSVRETTVASLKDKDGATAWHTAPIC